MGNNRKALVLVTPITAVLVLYPAGCLGQTLFKERIHFNVGTGWGSYDMRRGEVRILPPREFVYYEILNKRIEGGWEIYGEINIDITQNISLGPGIMHSSGERNLSEWYRGLFNDPAYRRPSPVLYKASIVSPYVNIGYKFQIDSLNVHIGGNLYYGFGTLNAEVRTYSIPSLYRKITYKSRGFGNSISLGFSIKVGRGYAIINEFGYRNLETGKLKDSRGIELDDSNLNFSGYFFRGGVILSPWSK
jgi:hypothetical protein